MLANVDPAAARARRPGLPLGLQRRLAHDAADARRSGRSSPSYAAAIVQANPGFRDVIVGNEPNLNRFWLPQFDLDGTGASAPAYLRLLAATLRRAQGGGAGRPRLGRRARAARRRQAATPAATRSPPPASSASSAQAYRASGRALPVMDGFSFHPYPLNSSVPVDALPSDPDHLGLIDQDILVRLLGKAFDGTAQVGSGMPILYDEFGIESAIPADKRELYGGVEPATTRPVAETDAGGGLPARDPARLLPVERRRHAPLPHPRRARAGRAGSPGSSTPTARPRRRSSPSGCAMEQAGTGSVGACPVVAKVSTAFTTRPTYDLAPMRARLHLQGPTPAPAAPDGGGDDDRPRGGRAAPPGPARAAGEHARLVPARRSRSSTRRCPGRPVERVSTPYVVRSSSPPRSLAAAEATARIAPRFWLEP